MTTRIPQKSQVCVPFQIASRRIPRMAHSACLSLGLYIELCKIRRSYPVRTKMKVPLGKGSFCQGLGTFLCKIPLRNLKNSVNILKLHPKFCVYIHFFLGRYPHCSSNYQKEPLFERTELIRIRQVLSIFENMWPYCTNLDSEHMVSEYMYISCLMYICSSVLRTSALCPNT